MDGGRSFKFNKLFILKVTIILFLSMKKVLNAN